MLRPPLRKGWLGILRQAVRRSPRDDTSRRTLCCESRKSAENIVLVFGDSKAGRRTLQRRMDETARSSPAVSSMQIQGVGWTEVESVRGSDDLKTFSARRQQMDLALVVVDPLGNVSRGSSSSSPPGPEEPPLSLNLSKAGEVGTILSGLLREGHQRVSLVFNIREEAAERYKATHGGNVEAVPALVRDIREQALAVALGDGEAGSGGVDVQQRRTEQEAVVESLTVDLSAPGAGEVVTRHVAQRLSKQRDKGKQAGEGGGAVAAEAVGGRRAVVVAPPLIPTKYSDGRSVVLIVNPEVKVSMNAFQHEVQDYCRANLIPATIYPLPLTQALSPDLHTRRQEAKRFHRATQHMTHGSLFLAESAAIPLIVSWTRDWKGRAMHDISSYSLANLNHHAGGLGAFVAGITALDRLSSGDKVLVVDLCACASNVEADEKDAHLLTSSLCQHLASLTQARQGNVPVSLQVDRAAWDSPLPPLSRFRLVILRGGCRMDKPLQSSRLRQVIASGLPLLTPELIKHHMEGPKVLQQLLHPWPTSRLSVQDARHFMQAAGLAQRIGGAAAAAAAGGQVVAGGKRRAVPDFGFRTRSHECGSCESWACRDCTRLQHSYYNSCGDHHGPEMGAEWREGY